MSRKFEPVQDIISPYAKSKLNNDFKYLFENLTIQGKTIQDLVAEGQLTPTQYANLINVVNGHIKNGQVTIHDIDKNKGKFDQTYLTQDLIDLITGSPNANILSEVAPNSVTTDKVASAAISAEKTTFLMDSNKNLFNGYINAIFTVRGGSVAEYFITSRYDSPSPHDGRLIIFPIKNNKNYSVTIHGDSNQFRLAKVVEYPEIPNGYERYPINESDVLADYSIARTHNFNSGNSNFGILYVSSAGQEPNVQINEGNNSDIFVNPFVLKEDYLDKKALKKLTNNIAIEDKNTGYPKRPDFPTVVYYGVNEPEDVEPFDEWRKMDGYTYYRDFTSTLVSGFSSPESSVSLDYMLDNGNPSLRINKDSTGNTFVVYDEVTNDNKLGVQEIFLEGRNGRDVVRGISALHHYNSDNTSPEYYAIGIVGNTLRLNKQSADKGTHVINFTTTINSMQPFKIRSRVDDGIIQAKAWQSDKAEPKDWQIVYVDSNPIKNNKLGVFTFGSYNYLYKIGVSTGGMTAPKRAWWL